SNRLSAEPPIRSVLPPPRRARRRAVGAALQLHACGLPRRGRAHHRVHLRRRHLPGEPVTTAPGAAAGAAARAVRAAAASEPRPLRGVSRLRGRRGGELVPGAVPAGARRSAGRGATDKRHAPPRDHDPADLLRAAFPGGSITGAPKVRAMQIIAELEPTQRAVYCGSIGYWSLSGTLDLSIVIRTCLALGRDVYFQVGGGIVADSDPEQEYRETLDKAAGVIAALAGAS